MRKFLISTLLLIGLVSPLRAAESVLEGKVQALHRGGHALADLWVGSDADLTFVYIDRALADAMSDSSAFNPRLQAVSDTAWRAPAGKFALVCMLDMGSSGTFDPKEVSCDGQALDAKDVAGNRSRYHWGEMRRGQAETWVWYLPKTMLDDGVLHLQWGDDSVDWRVPGASHGR